MNMRPLLCILFSLLISIPLQAAVSPVPVVTIDRVNLPKVALRISNPSKTDECRIWSSGVSWEEQNKWFSLRAAAGQKAVEFHPKIQCYTVNYPRAQSIPAGGSVTFEYDLSDDSQEGWVRPKDFAPGTWNFEIQAHLDIPREVYAHQYGVFMGTVTSPWYDAKGREVEPAGKPAPDAGETAIESRKDFPWKRLTDSLEKWDTATLSGDRTLADFFAADFPWDTIQTHYDLASGGSTLEILLPDRGVLTFRFRIEHPALTKLFKRKKGFGFPHDGWIDAKSVLPLTPAKGVQSIHLTKGESSRRSQSLFKRAFDSGGHIDKKATDDLRD
jgi:hypothetical protein